MEMPKLFGTILRKVSIVSGCIDVRMDLIC